MNDLLTNQVAEGLAAAKEDMLELLAVIEGLLANADEDVRRRAEVTWLAHIRCALDDDHEFLGGSMETMQDAIDDTIEGESA